LASSFYSLNKKKHTELLQPLKCEAFDIGRSLIQNLCLKWLQYWKHSCFQVITDLNSINGIKLTLFHFYKNF
jgi:hypothetical protein